jgi:hypothetical protein
MNLAVQCSICGAVFSVDKWHELVQKGLTDVYDSICPCCNGKSAAYNGEKLRKIFDGCNNAGRYAEMVFIHDNKLSYPCLIVRLCDHYLRPLEWWRKEGGLPDEFAVTIPKGEDARPYNPTHHFCAEEVSLVKI